jgi:hypothetical protein
VALEQGAADVEVEGVGEVGVEDVAALLDGGSLRGGAMGRADKLSCCGYFKLF